MEDDRKKGPSAEPVGNREGEANKTGPFYLDDYSRTPIFPHGSRAGALDANINQVVWPPLSYARYLMSVARNLIDDQEQFSIAVVVVHMACEVATEQKLSEAFTTKGLQYLTEIVMESLNGYNLSSERIRKIYVALTGDEVHNADFWSKFKESATRRNRIMHDGLIVDKAAAQESYKAADDLLVHFKI
jgi:hypothetical protein